MKHRLYKHIITFIAISFLGSAFAQKFDKKFTENFKTNKDVEVAINASNTEINVSTWNKNEVKIEAYIEIEGISKEEAEKYFESWEFEALGNSKKVKITSKGSNSAKFKNGFVFFDDMNFDFKMPDIDVLAMENIVIPEMDFDFDFDFENVLEDIEKNMEKNGEYAFIFNNGEHKVEIKSKEEWEAFQKTKEYREIKRSMEMEKQKIRKKLTERKVEMRKKVKESQEKMAKLNKEKVKQDLLRAKEHLEKLKLDFNFTSEDNHIKINGKKVKIIKRLEIKVPKGATFDLNTRHCKVKLPNTVAFGNIKYGAFDINNLIGGRLTVDYSKVNINDLNACTLFLNNVTDAKIASVTNATLSNNSSGVHIIRINQNVNLLDKFGELTIDSFNPNFGQFVLNLSQSNATISLGTVASKFEYEVNKVKVKKDRVHKSTGNNSTKNVIKVQGDYSNVVIK